MIAMQSASTPRRALAPLALVLASALGACVAPDVGDPYDSTGYLPGAGLDAVQPADIAVAPVALRLEEEVPVPVDDLRQALYAGLVDRLYSPLALDYVDDGGAPDAVLEVTVLGWDTSQLAYDGTLVARAEAAMVRGDEVLWAVELTRRLNDDVGGTQRSDPAASQARSVVELAAEVLALLPERDPLVAR